MTLETVPPRPRGFSLLALREAVERATSVVVVSGNGIPEVVGQTQEKAVEVKTKAGGTVVPSPDYFYGPT